MYIYYTMNIAYFTYMQVYEEIPMCGHRTMPQYLCQTNPYGKRCLLDGIPLQEN